MASGPATEAQATPRRYRFASYELDARAGELHKLGMRLRLQDKPLQILLALLERPGEVVSREQLTTRLWPAGTFVDFDLSLNAAMRRLRDVLNDSAESPRYIETLPRLGYRFIAAVEVLAEPEPAPQPMAPEERGGEQAAPARAWRWSLRVAVAAGVVLLALATGLGGWRWTQPRPSVEFSQRDWVLISQFENRTGNPSLDGSLETLLEREISNSHYVNVAPQERVRDTMRLMRLQMEGRPALAVAREVAVRDGGIKAVVAGKAERIGGRYVLGASVVLPADGVTVSSYTEEAGSDKQIVPAMRRLSDRLRERLGEDLADIQRSREALEKATTPSLPALRLFSHSMTYMLNEDWAAAARLLEEALRAAPSFATAHVYLAYCYTNLDDERSAAPHWEEALRLSSQATESERLFIVASYYDSYHVDLKKANQMYETLVNLYPNHYWAINNLAFNYLELHPDEPHFVQLIARRADMRPSDFRSQYFAWFQISEARDYELAGRYLVRAKNLLTPSAQRLYPEEASYLEFAHADELFREGKLAEVASELDRLGKTYNAREPFAQDALAENEGTLNLYYLGRLHSAQSWIERMQESESRNAWLADLAEARGDDRALRAAVRREFALGQGGPGLVVRLARLGLLKEADVALARLRKSRRPKSWRFPGYVHLAAGAVDLAHGRTDQAMDELRTAVDEFRHLESRYLAMAAQELARALEKKGDTAAAVAVLQSLQDERRLEVIGSWQLWQAYRKLGRIQEAKVVEAELRRSLAYADSDHPVLESLRAEVAASKPTPNRAQSSSVASSAH